MNERPATIVISDWLANCQAGQWTPFEAATALKAALAKEGYGIAPAQASASLIEAVAELQAWREDVVKLRDLAIDEGNEAIERRCFNILLTRHLYPVPSTDRASHTVTSDCAGAQGDVTPTHPSTTRETPR